MPSGKAISVGSREEQAVLRTLRGRILGGEFPPGSRLPTRSELEAEFGYGWSPIQRAFDRLKRDGFVRTRRSQGTFVVDAPPHLTTYAIVVPKTRQKRWRSLYYQALEMAARD